MNKKGLFYACGAIAIAVVAGVAYMQYSTKPYIASTSDSKPVLNTTQPLSVPVMPADQKREDLRTYTNTQFGYTFAYPNSPDNWYLDAKKPSEIHLTDGKGGHRLITVTIATTSKPLDTLVAAEIKDMVKISANSKAKADQHPVDVDGKQGRYLSIPKSGDNNNAEVVVINGPRAYYIMGDDSTSDKKEAFDKIVSSFKFLSKK